MVRESFQKQRKALITWLMMVARAAPATPRLITDTNTRSSPTLITEEMIRYFMGLRLSPTDCRIPAPML